MTPQYQEMELPFDLAEPEPVEAAPGKSPGRWQFPFLCASLLASGAALLFLWATAPGASQIEQRWSRRVRRALETKQVDRAVEIWEAWSRENPRSKETKAWPAIFFEAYANRVKAQSGDGLAGQRALYFHERAMEIGAAPAQALRLRRTRAELLNDLGRFDEAAQAYGDLGDRMEQARMLLAANRPQEALETASRVSQDPGVSPQKLDRSVLFQLGIHSEGRDWSSVIGLHDRCAALPGLHKNVVGKLKLSAARSLFEIWRQEGKGRPERLAAALQWLDDPKVLEGSPGKFFPFYLRGEIEYACARYSKAADAFDRALDTMTESAAGSFEGVVRARIGDIWVKQGNSDKAFESYKGALRSGIAAEGEAGHWATLVEIYANMDTLAAQWRHQQRWNRAVEAKELLMQHASHPERHVMDLAQLFLKRAEAHLAAGRSAEAQEDRLRAALSYQDFIRKNPFTREYLNILWQVGLLLKEVGNLPDGAQAMQEFVERGRSHDFHSEVMYDLGCAWKSMGRYSEAIDVFEQNVLRHLARASSGSPFRETGFPRAVYRSKLELGNSLLSRGRPGDHRKARDVFQANLADDGIDPASQVWRDSLFGLARALARMAQEAALKEREDLLRESSGSWDHFLRRYEWYRGAKPSGITDDEYVEGRDLYQRALREKGWVDAQLGKWTDVIKEWEETLRLGEDLPEGAFAFFFGEAYLHTQRFQEAEELYSQVALSESGAFRGISFYRLGDLYRRSGQTERSQEAYRRVQEIVSEASADDREAAFLRSLVSWRLQ